MDDRDEDAICIVEHTADWALRIRGGDLAELFRHAAEGLARLLVADIAVVGRDETRELTLESYDVEGLLVDWLGELAYWAERDGLVFPEVEMRQVTPTRLAAVVRGGRASELQKHIKAVTYHDLAIRKTESGLEVTVVFDV
ncbi:MAG TPA: archease [Promineifilum sp.]|nr:archease [Promineifilum sp.]